MKILVVDDDLELQEMYKYIFESNGYDVYQAFNGKEALKKVYEVNPDLIILDILMPEMDGFEVMEELRLKPETCLIPVIMLTSLSATKDKLTGIKLGADEYLVKPADPYELLARVEGLLKRYYDTIGASALTKLPGMPKLEMDIKTRLVLRDTFSIIYLDINNFKPYNTKYSYESGDKVLKLFSGILRATVADYGTSKDFIYHLGTDHFVVLTIEDCSMKIVDNIINLFNELVKKSYDLETISQGYFWYQSSSGKEEKGMLMTLSIGIANIVPGKFQHYSQVLDYVKDLWRIAKQESRNTNSNTFVTG